MDLSLFRKFAERLIYCKLHSQGDNSSSQGQSMQSFQGDPWSVCKHPQPCAPASTQSVFQGWKGSWYWWCRERFFLLFLGRSLKGSFWWCISTDTSSTRSCGKHLTTTTWESAVTWLPFLWVYTCPDCLPHTSYKFPWTNSWCTFTYNGTVLSGLSKLCWQSYCPGSVEVQREFISQWTCGAACKHLVALWVPWDANS